MESLILTVVNVALSFYFLFDSKRRYSSGDTYLILDNFKDMHG